MVLGAISYLLDFDVCGRRCNKIVQSVLLLFMQQEKEVLFRPDSTCSHDVRATQHTSQNVKQLSRLHCRQRCSLLTCMEQAETTANSRSLYATFLVLRRQVYEVLKNISQDDIGHVEKHMNASV